MGLNKFWLIAFCSISFLAYGQEGNLPFSLVSNGDGGLTNNRAPFRFKDSFGFVWIGTENGLNRFAGNRLTTFQPVQNDSKSLSSAIIQSNFFEDNHQNIWFGTSASITCFVRKTGDFLSFQILENEVLISNDSYRVFFLEKRRFLWVVAGKGFYRFDINTGESQFLHPLSDVANFAVDTSLDGSVRRVFAARWLYGKGIYVIDYGPDLTKPAINLRLSTSNVRIKALTVIRPFLDENRTAWLATDLGLVRFNPDDSTKNRLFDSWKRLPLRVRDIASAGPNRLVLATNREPILFFDKDSLSFLQGPDITMTNRQLRFDDGADDLMHDREGTIWVHVRGKGVFYRPLKSNPFVHPFSLKKEAAPNITSITTGKKEVIWLFSESKKCWLSKKLAFAHYDWFPKIKKGFVDEVNRLWGNAWSVFGLVDLQNRKFEPVPLPGTPSIFLFMPVGPSKIWLGTTNGLFVFDTRTGETAKVAGAEKTFDSGHIDRKNRFWAFDLDGKLDVFQRVGDDSLTFIRTIPGVEYLNSFHETAHFMWAATSKGLLRIDLDSFGTRLFDESLGWPNHYIQSILEDKTGRFWMGNNRGILRIDPNNPTDFRQFTTADGLSSNEYSSDAALLAANGEMWFGGKNGLDIFRPEAIGFIGHAPQLGLLDLKIHGKSWAGDSAIFVKNRLELDFTQNALTFDLAAMEYLNPAKNQFKCRLAGYDREWVWLGTQDFITYANLPPGSYRFEFTACNTEGIWQEVPRGIEVIIHPPWWQTTWFRVLMCLLLVLAGYSLYRYRISHLQREFKLRQNALENEKKALESTISALLAQMNPHFIFNSLNSINAFILKNEGLAASQYLHQFAGLMRQILDYSSMKTISLEQEIGFLENYLAIESLRMHGRLAWKISLADDVDDFDTQIPPMILQPFVENSIWHGISPKPDGGLILIHFKTENGSLVCSVEDNGAGRKATDRTDKKHDSKALKITAERLHLFDSQRGGAGKSAFKTIDLTDENGLPTGTKVELRLFL